MPPAIILKLFAQFYETYLLGHGPRGGDGDCAAVAVSPAFSRGMLYATGSETPAAGHKAALREMSGDQVPCSFSLTVVDENKRAIYYNEEFRDVIVKTLAMICPLAGPAIQAIRGAGMLCFIDEPILSAFGSSTYVSVRRDDVIHLLKDMIDAVHAEGGVAGMHCCGNTEWSIPIDAGVDIISFDAFQYGETIRHVCRGRQNTSATGRRAWPGDCAHLNGYPGTD